MTEITFNVIAWKYKSDDAYIVQCYEIPDCYCEEKDIDAGIAFLKEELKIRIETEYTLAELEYVREIMENPIEVYGARTFTVSIDREIK